MPMTYATVEEDINTFALYKKYMKPWIDDLLGWDEQFQYAGFTLHLLPSYFRWILIDDVKVGITCLQEEDGYTKLSLLIIFEEYQGNGYAFQFLTDLVNRSSSGTTLIWNCLKNNTPAIALYSKIENVDQTELEYFYQYKVIKS